MSELRAILATIARVRCAAPDGADVMAVCDELERRLMQPRNVEVRIGALPGLTVDKAAAANTVNAVRKAYMLQTCRSYCRIIAGRRAAKSA